MVAFLMLGILVLGFSLYLLFIADDALTLGVSLLRVLLSIVGLTALRFDHEVVLSSVIFLYTLSCLLLLAITRSEVQIKHDQP